MEGWFSWRFRERRRGGYRFFILIGRWDEARVYNRIVILNFFFFFGIKLFDFNDF